MPINMGDFDHAFAKTREEFPTINQSQCLDLLRAFDLDWQTRRFQPPERKKRIFEELMDEKLQNFSAQDRTCVKKLIGYYYGSRSGRIRSDKARQGSLNL